MPLNKSVDISWWGQDRKKDFYWKYFLDKLWIKPKELVKWKISEGHIVLVIMEGGGNK